MTGYIGITDKYWFKFNKTKNNKEVVFWRKAKTPIRLKEGSYFFFLVKGTRLIEGYGKISTLGSATIEELWKKYGQTVGCSSYSELINNLEGDEKDKNEKVGFYRIEQVKYFKGGIDTKETGVDFKLNIVSGRKISQEEVQKILNTPIKNNFKLTILEEVPDSINKRAEEFENRIKDLLKK